MSSPRIFEPEYYARMRALEAGSWWNAGMRDVAEALLREAGLPRQGVLLDAGCGSGQTMTWFGNTWPEWRAVGLDVSMDGLRAALDGGQRGLVGASALSVPLSDATADLVISLDVLQHLPLPAGTGEALREFHRVLRPGGWLLIRTNAQSWPHAPDDLRFDFHKFTPRELRHHLTAAGFVVHRLGRLNALLGLVEVPREWRARRHGGGTYTGLLSTVPQRNLAWSVKRAWLRLEGHLVRQGLSLPLGRSILALAQIPRSPRHD